MTGLLTPALRKALGPVRAERVEYETQHKITKAMTAVKAQIEADHQERMSELRDSVAGWNERLDAIERGEVRAG